ncbi:hypothetical protein RFI_21959 [Reticulomyxa filosa]|uniref:Uncharacterized protein n=1 Tax=Reticulomyxa filosa TaxID=46433 RepID=X6MQR7_RETFI|nr:hypothetical protein RFI_21959 [Reticulomyxa filosa]|eukprot:ETO15410.1 hypothetical protein RFI_21959 [Reticulomyxa filosa]
MCEKDEDAYFSVFYKRTISCLVFLYVTCILFCGLAFVGCLSHSHAARTILVTMGLTIFFVCYFSGNFFLYLFYVGRLHFTFQDTIYAVSTMQLRLLYVPFVLFWIFTIIQNPLWPLWTGLYLLVYVSSKSTLMTLFFKRLIALATQRPDSIFRIEQTSSNSINDELTLSESQLRYITVMTKYSILVIVSLLICLAPAIVTIAYSFLPTPIAYTMGWISTMLSSVNAAANLWCLYLQFAFASHYYQQCCHCCHSLLQSNVIRKVKDTTYVITNFLFFQRKYCVHFFFFITEQKLLHIQQKFISCTVCR